ncbi:hypothetical protein [Halobacterium yunchengense]|uniref:hypothetical protein n=1 Tax=Halobacterium yunchengense TaxID=3108497 RepID=UPI00300A760C
MTLSFDPLDGEPGVRIRDASEGETVDVRTDRPVDPVAVPPAVLDGPVDAAAAVTATELRLPVVVHVLVRRDGEVVHQTVDGGDPVDLPTGTYELDLSLPNVKLYVRAPDCAPTASFVDGETRIAVADPCRFVLGARSHHETPAGTVRVTEDPRDLMAGVSAFGSALKTLSPDRSWPTLRGHPPALEFGDGLDVPEAVEPPETGVTLEVPPEYHAIYTAAPLAFYLGASVEPGTEPRLVADGVVHEFDAAGLAAGVRDVLEHVFTLDCVVREAGVYPYRTPLSDAVDAAVDGDLDYEALFEVPLAERTAAYLGVPRSATAGLLDWHYAADVAARPRTALVLPYLADELAVVRSPPRSADSASADAAVAPADAAASPPSPPSVVTPADAGTPGHCWVDGGFAAGASNPTVGSYRRALDWPRGTDPLTVHVVSCGDRPDAADAATYGTHAYQETAVRTSRDLTTSELRDVLYDDVDFLHFAGDVTEAGMVCRDGVLDVRTLARTGVKAFFLDGCRSHEQGRALLTAGAVGGLVTVDDAADAGERRVGRTVSLLLDDGFPLYGVLDALRATRPPGDRYAILGSGTLAFRRSASAVPVLYAFDGDGFDDGETTATARYYPYGEHGMGSLFTPMHPDADSTIVSAYVREERVQRAALERWLAGASTPVVVDGELHRTPELSLADFE